MWVNEQSDRMRFFDAHCDTVMRTLDGSLDFVAGQGRSHIDLPRLLAAGHCVQIFAAFAPRSQFPDRDLRAFAAEIFDTIRGWVAGSDGRMRLVETGSDVRDASSDLTGLPVYALLGLEGADPLEGKAENLEHFHQAGLRNVIPAWSDNAFSGTSMGSGGPLTDEGAELIAVAEALRVMVDVSHLSDAAFEQVCLVARQPFVASHSNCRALCPSPRNLTDDQIRALADRGGVMGINLAADFLAPDYLAAWDAITVPAQAAAQAASDPEAQRKIWEAARTQRRAIPLPAADWIARHVRHAIEVGGEDCIGLGGDLDGITTMPVSITGVESYPAIAELLSVAGLTRVQVEKVCWRNMTRVYASVLG